MNTQEAGLKHEDLAPVSNIFVQEFNDARLTMHDRVLVFKVLPMEDGLRDIKNMCQRSRNETTDQESLLDENMVRRKEMITLEQKEKRKTGEKETNLVEKEEKTESGNDETLTEPEERTKGIMTKHGQHSNRQVKGDGTEKLAELSVHTSLLASHSTYFKTLFFGSFKESNLKDVVMKIDAGKLQAHLTLIEAMYKLDILHNKDYNLVLDVLVLADKYNANSVKMKCNNVLMASSLTLEKCQNIIEKVDKLTEVDSLLCVVQKFIAKEFSPLDKTWRTQKFSHLTEALLRLLLASDDLAVQSENTVFVALMRWINLSLRKSRISLEELENTHSTFLGLVRFEFMSVDFLYDVVRHHKLAKQMIGFHEYVQQGLAYHAFSKKRRNKLKVKPVPRAVFKDNDQLPTFSWVIDKDVREILADSQEAHSDSFWFHGYQLELKMSYSAKSETFGFYLVVLELQNVQEEFSHPDFDWIAESDLFDPSNTLLTLPDEAYENEDTYSGFPILGSSFPLHSFPEGLSHKVDVFLWVNLLD